MIKNVKSLPIVMYGKHMSAGVAEYREPGKSPYRILVNEVAIREMDASFQGKPVFVQHVDQVDLDTLQVDADGYVVESFFNTADGAHWVKMILVSDKAKDAVKSGYRLSNAYTPLTLAGGGISKGVEYQKEVMSGVYDHMALVNDPRYEDSILLTPDQFQAYNQQKLTELKSVANSLVRGTRNMFKLFKKTEVMNSDELNDTIVKLPKSGKEISIASLINAADEAEDKLEAHEHKAKPDAKSDKNPQEAQKQGEQSEEKDAPPQMANEDHHVPMGDGSMRVGDMAREHKEMKDCLGVLAKHMQPKNDSELDGGEKDAEKVQPADLTKRNADEDGGEKEAISQEKQEDLTKRNSKSAEQVAGDKFFNALKDAPNKAFEANAGSISVSQTELGRSRYGSDN